MHLKFCPANNAKDSSFISDENADVIEVHTKDYIFGISFCVFKVWRWIWTYEKYQPNDEFDRLFEFEFPTIGLMVLRNQKQ